VLLYGGRCKNEGRWGRDWLGEDVEKMLKKKRPWVPSSDRAERKREMKMATKFTGLGNQVGQVCAEYRGFWLAENYFSGRRWRRREANEGDVEACRERGGEGRD